MVCYLIGSLACWYYTQSFRVYQTHVYRIPLSMKYTLPYALIPFFNSPFWWSFHERLHKGPFEPRYWKWKGHTGTLPWKLKRLALWWQLAASSDIFPSTFGNFSFSWSYCLMSLCSSGDHHVHGPKCFCVCVCYSSHESSGAQTGSVVRFHHLTLCLHAHTQTGS